MNTTGIRCRCGQRIVARDVLRRNWFTRVFGPSFIYLKFRCSRCKRVGEKFIQADRWDESLLGEVPCETSPEERKAFSALGKITQDEQVEFHFALDDPQTLRSAWHEPEE
jgi:DNA-directed RNA polymerase subunit RPC12/RpoP